MKAIAFLVFFAGTSVAMADDSVLQNGDFSDGLNHWEGDGQTVAAATFDASVTPPTSGIVIKLSNADWTKITQDFSAKIGEYSLNLTYQCSPDLAFSSSADNYTNIPMKLGFNRLKPFSANPGEWAVIIVAPGAKYYTYWTIPAKIGTGSQTLTLPVKLDSNDPAPKSFYLVFPPGQGFINLQSITMVPATASALREETADFIVTGEDFQVANLLNNANAFSNRDYLWQGIPDRFNGWRVTQSAGGKPPVIEVEAKHDVTIYAATAPQQAEIDLSGWTRTEGASFAYTDKKNTQMAVYEKQLSAGEKITLPQGDWSGMLLLLPPSTSSN